MLPGASYVEMERSQERSFCCGAGGARMWMEENIGERINTNRTKEAVATGADQIAVGCPFCRVMLSDGLTAEQASGGAREEVEVLDVAQMLLASVKGESATRTATKAAPAASAAPVETKAEPEPGDETQTPETVTETGDVGPAAKASGGSSLFDVDDETATEAAEPAPQPAARSSTPRTRAGARRAGRPDARPHPAAERDSLFDVEPEETERPSPASAPAATRLSTSRTSERTATARSSTSDDEPAEESSAPVATSASGEYTGSLFDVEDDDHAKPAPDDDAPGEAATRGEEARAAQGRRPARGRLALRPVTPL